MVDFWGRMLWSCFVVGMAIAAGGAVIGHVESKRWQSIMYVLLGSSVVLGVLSTIGLIWSMP